MTAAASCHPNFCTSNPKSSSISDWTASSASLPRSYLGPLLLTFIKQRPENRCAGFFVPRPIRDAATLCSPAVETLKWTNLLPLYSRAHTPLSSPPSPAASVAAATEGPRGCVWVKGGCRQTCHVTRSPHPPAYPGYSSWLTEWHHCQRQCPIVNVCCPLGVAGFVTMEVKLWFYGSNRQNHTGCEYSECKSYKI